MTQEEKQILIKDLCGRLPYGIKVWYPNGNGAISTVKGIVGDVCYFNENPIYDNFCHIETVKPYLRPMSSMTEEECITLSKLIPYETDAWKYIKTPVPLYIANIEQFDFFHRHHLDWRGLIPKGLALEAPEGMYE